MKNRINISEFKKKKKDELIKPCEIKNLKKDNEKHENDIFQTQKALREALDINDEVIKTFLFF